jgi:hypothetical protein
MHIPLSLITVWKNKETTQNICMIEVFTAVVPEDDTLQNTCMLNVTRAHGFFGGMVY